MAELTLRNGGVSAVKWNESTPMEATVAALLRIGS